MTYNRPIAPHVPSRVVYQNVTIRKFLVWSLFIIVTGVIVFGVFRIDELRKDNKVRDFVRWIGLKG